MLEEGWKERKATISKIKEHVLTLLLRKEPLKIMNSESLRKASSELSLNSSFSFSNDSITSSTIEHKDVRLTPSGSPMSGSLSRRRLSSPRHVKVQRIRNIERSQSFPLKPALRRDSSLASSDSGDSAASSPVAGRHVTFSKYALLLAAASENSVAELQTLLDKDPSYINKPSSSGQTPLHKAASKGHKESIELLIERGADANFADKQGKTPMFISWEKGHQECFKLMLQASRTKKDSKNGFL